MDVAIRRWQAFTRRDAVHAATGQTFEDVAGDRKDAQPAPLAPKSARARRRADNETQAPTSSPLKTHPTRLATASRRSTRASSLASLDIPVGGPGSRNFRTAVREALKEKITIREGDRTRTVSKMDAIIQVTFNKALKGDAKALVAFLQFVRWAGLMDEQPELSSTESISAEDEAILAGYLDRHGLKPQLRREAAGRRRQKTSPTRQAKEEEPGG